MEDATTAVPQPRPARRRRARLRLLVAAAGLAALGAVVVLLDHALGTCEPLDRLLGRSGCVAVLRLENLSPLPFTAAVPLEGGDRDAMRVFGQAVGQTHLEPVQLVVDLAQGETSRAPMPFGPGTWTFAVRRSLDGATLSVVCFADPPCSSPGVDGVVLRAADGAVLAEVSTAEPPDWWVREGAVPVHQMGDTRRDARQVVYPDPDTGGLLLVSLDTGEQVGALAPPDPLDRGYELSGHGWAEMVAARASPSGRFVALIDNQRPAEPGGSRIELWDVEAGRLLRRIEVDARHRIATNAAWTADETRLVAFHDRSGRDADLYVFQLR